MCGLAGELRFDGERADVAAIARACTRMAQRGPDGSGIWANGPAALGHQRLAIIDLSAAGAQPMADPDLGLTVAFNGCIYNYEKLRDELGGLGHRFFSHSDTEVIGKAYAQWGTSCVERFKGMFAFAIVERYTGRVILARDRLGIKPLYLDQTAERLRFASSLPALLAAGGADTSLDLVALSHYMTFHSVVPAPRTILQGIRKLPPATVRTVEADGTSTDVRYWDPPFARDPERADWSAQDWQDALLDSLRTAVQRRMVADVPVGVLLSGGIDSSLVVALLAEAGQTGLQTFSIGFDSAGGESGDEFEYSDIVARHFGTDHHRIKIDSSRLLPGIDGAVSAMNEPMVSHDCVAFYLLSEDVAKSVKVVQSGQGADEILAGYDWYPPMRDVGRDHAVERYADVFFDRPFDRLESLLDPAVADRPRRAARVRDRGVRPSGCRVRAGRGATQRHDGHAGGRPVKRGRQHDHGMGARGPRPVPRPRCRGARSSYPVDLKLADGGKGVLKRASRGIVPDAIIDRTKGYFPVPAIRQLDGRYLQRVRDALTDPVARERGLFRPAAVETMLADPNTTRTTLGSNALWQLGLIEMWLQAMDVR